MTRELTFDDSESSVEEPDFFYDLTPYNFNMDIEGLLRRFGDQDILIPSFQRNYVWTIEGASMFIDSVLRGLPTPSLFFYEENAGKYLVIDGQQRLLTLYYYIRGIYPKIKQHQNIKVYPNIFDIDFSNVQNNTDNLEGIPFRLSGKNVSGLWKGKTFTELSPEQKKRIRNTYIYIIDLKQTSPSNDNSSMYLVYERINTGSTRLNPQQIRICVSHGKYAQFLCEKAVDQKWGEKFGINDTSSGISELILRFISLYYSNGTFKGSMKTYLDKELRDKSNFQLHSEKEITKLYNNSFKILISLFTAKSFKPKNSFVGYFLLVTWVALALLTKKTKNIDSWLSSNKEKILQGFNKVCKNADVVDFYTNTRRASNPETLKNVIMIIYTHFCESING